LSTPRPLNIGWISSHVPKRCGIATFSRDLIEGMHLHTPDMRVFSVATESPTESFKYPEDVVAVTKTNDATSFEKAAQILNTKPLDALVLQHEYGLFGGNETAFEKDGNRVSFPLGDNVLALVDQVKVPLVTTLHTVLPEPDAERREIIRQLADRSARLVTMTHDSRILLEQDYGIKAGKITVIPHGVPTATPVTTAEAKRRLKLPENEPIMMITGLIGPNKGVEQALRSLPQILETHSNVSLYVVGQTHPNIVSSSGESYRESLMALAKVLGVAPHLKFVNDYLPLEELVHYMQAADIYLTLHRDMEQAASGTLAYAVGAGLVAVSTPYRYARELLGDGRGFVVPLDDTAATSRTIVEVLSNQALFDETRRKARTYGTHMQWDAVGKTYAELIAAVAQTTKG
jgi:glycosyltransferase involved in cell wall biosynthesis